METGLCSQLVWCENRAASASDSPIDGYLNADVRCVDGRQAPEVREPVELYI